MNCPRCGTENPDSPDAHFCRSCGAQLATPSPSDTDRLTVVPAGVPPLPPSAPYYAPAGQPAVPVQAAVFPYGGFWIRFVASLIDWVILGVVSWFLGLFIAAAAWLDIPGAEVFGSLVGLFVNLTYEVLLTSAAGGTLGKLVLGYHVVDQNGRHIGYGRSLGRWLSKIISAVVLLLGFIWVGIDAYKQGWHDKIAGTYVVRKEFVKA